MNLQADIITCYIVFPCNNMSLNRQEKGKTIIDPISSNIFTKLIHCNVFSADEISDHDEPYAIFNISKKYNCCGPLAFKSQRVAYQSNQKLLHHC